MGVGTDDLAVLTAAWMSKDGDGNYDPAVDMNMPPDGVIDIEDFALLAKFWGMGTGQ